MFISSHVTGHKFLEDVYEDSMLFPSQINRFLCNRLDEPLKASRRPLVPRSFSVEDVRTSEQHLQKLGQASPISTRSWISVDTIWELSAKRPDDVATHPDATQRSRIFFLISKNSLKTQRGATLVHRKYTKVPLNRGNERTRK
jgi:hypothetical protein